MSDDQRLSVTSLERKSTHCEECGQRVEFCTSFDVRLQIDCPFCGGYATVWEHEKLSELRNRAEREIFEEMREAREAMKGPITDDCGVISILEAKFGWFIRTAARTRYHQIKNDFEGCVERRAEQLIEIFRLERCTPRFIPTKDGQ